jgi:two-component system chemotaxis response regulator CheB
MSRLRVLVVEDSLTVRKRLCEVLETDKGIEVVGEAEDGSTAIALCESLRPDIVTLDMMLPVMSGLAATEYIMAHCPTPILIVSSSVNRGELFKTYEALAAGALEVLEKPSADEFDGEWERRFIALVKLVARIKVITHPRGRLNARKATAHAPLPPHGKAMPPAESPVAPAAAGRPCRLVAIGASTGGPRAVVEVLRGLPDSFALPILLVVHIGEPFGAAFADWLDGQTPHRVRIAQDGQPLPASGVLMAPPDRHLLVRGNRLRLSDAPERHSCRPSVDVLFESVAAECGAAAAACLLTGMGQDGARGLLAIRQAGGMTIAQDEATSVVYGMPREAALLDAARHVLPLGAIGPALARLTMHTDSGEDSP